jgi:hypothetical protein
MILQTRTSPNRLALSGPSTEPHLRGKVVSLPEPQNVVEEVGCAVGELELVRPIIDGLNSRRKYSVDSCTHEGLSHDKAPLSVIPVHCASKAPVSLPVIVILT